MENRDTRIKRLLYQSDHRGCKETDFLLGNFAKKYLLNFSDNEIDLYEKFIMENDWDIYAWLTGNLPLPDEHKNNVTDLIFESMKNST